MKRLLLFLSAALAAFLLAACGSSGAGNASFHFSSPSTTTQSASSLQTPVPVSPQEATPVAPPQGTPSANAKTYEEIVDNRNDVMLSPDTTGSAPTTALRYGTHVDVACWAPNASGMASINAFYLIVGPGSLYGYAPANTFANGDPLGATGSTQIDPAVPECTMK